MTAYAPETPGDSTGPDLFEEWFRVPDTTTGRPEAAETFVPLAGVPNGAERQRPTLPGYLGRLMAGRPAFTDPEPQADPQADPLPVLPVEPFPVTSTMRLGEGWYFAALGVIYTAEKAGKGRWTARRADGGPVIAEAADKGGVVAAVWSATGAADDVPAPTVVEREGRGRYGTALRRLDVTCESAGLSLVWESRDGGGFWAEECPRCSGSGHLPSYDHVQGGVCFGPCEGSGTVGAYDTADAMACVRREARAARIEADTFARTAFRAAWRWDQFAEDWPEVAGWISAACRSGNTFAGEMRGLVQGGKELSEAQRAACREAAGREAVARIQAAEVERERVARVKRSRTPGVRGERVTVTGTVTRAFRYQTGPAYRQHTKCGLVIDDGAGVCVLVQSTAKEAFARREGERVTVTGEVKDPENRDRMTGEVQARLGGKLTITQTGK